MFGTPVEPKDASRLQPMKWIFYRYRNGKRVKVIIKERDGNRIKIAFPKTITKKYETIDLADPDALNQFTVGIAKYDPKTMRHPFRVGDRLDIHVAYPPKYKGWFPAEVRRLSKYSTQICTVYHPDDTRRRTYYVDGINKNEVTRFGGHQKEYKFVHQSDRKRLKSLDKMNGKNQKMKPSNKRKQNKKKFKRKCSGSKSKKPVLNHSVPKCAAPMKGTKVIPTVTAESTNNGKQHESDGADESDDLEIIENPPLPAVDESVQNRDFDPYCEPLPLSDEEQSDHLVVPQPTVDPVIPRTVSIPKRNRNRRNSESVKCGKCGEILSSFNRFKTHLQETHPDYRPFHCSKCNTTFQHPGYMKKHYEENHTTTRPYRCPYCRHTFKKPAQCKKHVIKEHNDNDFKPKIDKNRVQSFHVEGYTIIDEMDNV